MAPPSSSPVELLGRFEIRGTVGAGGMGSVYAAYDPDLDRDVALKVLGGSGESSRLVAGSTINLRDASPALAAMARSTDVLEPGADDSEQGIGSLVNEARAMAKLSHPNVVSVYEIGSDDDRLFIAMELVEGENLREWLASGARTVEEILGAYKQAASGLAAAHRVGLVHRDFKPENVLIDKEGIVQVADFGLALGGQPRGRSLHRIGGGLAGTPGYIAPELERGGAATAASDVYSFCVSLAESLGGERPDEPLSDEAAESLVSSLGKLPANVRSGLLAGLRSDPSARPESAHELVTMFAEPGRSKWWLVAAAMTALACVGGGVAIAASLAGEKDSSCERSWTRVTSVWNQERAAEIRDKLASIEGSISKDSADRLAQLLNRRAERLHAAHHATCVSRERGEVESDLARTRDACLTTAASAFEATALVAGDIFDVAELSRIVGVAEDRGDVARCLELETARTVQTDPRGQELAGRLDALQARMRIAPSASKAHSPEIATIIEEARTLEHPLLLARAVFAQAEHARRLADFALAKSSAREAIASATNGGDDFLAARATIFLAETAANHQGDAGEGETLIALAEAALSRVPQARGLRAELHLLRAVFARIRSRYAEADAELTKAVTVLETVAEPAVRIRNRVLFERAALEGKKGRYQNAHAHFIALAEEAKQRLGPNHPRHANLLSLSAFMLTKLGKAKEALPIHDEAIKIFLDYGEKSRVAVEARHRRGLTLNRLGRFEEARKQFQEVFEIRSTGSKALRSGLAASHHHIAVSSLNLGDLDMAKEHFLKELQLAEENFGKSHRKVGNALAGLGDVATREGRHEDALRHLNRARAINAKIHGDAHRFTAKIDLDIGKVYLAQKKFERACEKFAANEKVLAGDPDAPLSALGGARAVLAQCLVELRRPKEAIPIAEQAIADLEKAKLPNTTAMTRFTLGRALFAVGDREKGRALVAEALKVIEVSKTRHRKERPKLEAWLAKHR